MSYSDDFQNLIKKYNDEIKIMKSKSKNTNESYTPNVMRVQQSNVVQQTPSQPNTALPRTDTNVDDTFRSVATRDENNDGVIDGERIPPVRLTPEEKVENKEALKFPFTNDFKWPTIPEELAIKGSTEDLTGTGYLTVRVFTAREASPIENATVIISQTDGTGEKLLHSVLTNSSGETPRYALPTVPQSESLKPGVKNPYAAYKIRVTAEGFFTVDNINVPIFDNQSAVQPVEMLPLPENFGGDETLDSVQTGSITLQ